MNEYRSEAILQRAQNLLILHRAYKLLAADAEWDESKHPRAENGQFGSGRPSENNLDGRGKVNFPELSADEIEALAKTPIAVASEMTQGARQKAVKAWLKGNLQGKSVKTRDGKAVQFNSFDSVTHMSLSGRRQHINALLTPHIADVFANGNFVGRQLSDHDRKDRSITAFHAYRKPVNVGGYRVLMEVHAAERAEGKFEFAAYAFKRIKEKGKPSDK